MERQEVLIREFEVAGLELFNYKDGSHLTERVKDIYLALARFYLGRSEDEHVPRKRKEEDRERFLLYINKVIALDKHSDGNPQTAVAFRMKSILRMFDFKAEAARKDRIPDRARLDALLKEMKSDLGKSHKAYQYDAGAYYNLSYVLGELEGKLFEKDSKPDKYRENLLEAITELERLRERRSKIQPIQQAKFLPDASINLACFHVRYANLTAPAEALLKKMHQDKALESCWLGKTIAKENYVLEKFLKNLASELDGELKSVQAQFPDEMSKILNPAQDKP